MRKVTATLEIIIEVMIDDTNEIVKEYENDKELIIDCYQHDWSQVLPVIEDKGIKLIDTNIFDYEQEENK